MGARCVRSETNFRLCVASSGLKKGESQYSNHSHFPHSGNGLSLYQFLPSFDLQRVMYCIQVPFLLALLLWACSPRCEGLVQENSCQIQSYIRKMQGSSAGNLLRVQLDRNDTNPEDISFNGTCTDSRELTTFILSKKYINGTLRVNILWEKDRNFALAIKAGLLKIERAGVSNRHGFAMRDVPRKCQSGCHVTFQSMPKGLLYMKTNVYGLPLTGKDSNRRGTWYDVEKTFCV